MSIWESGDTGPLTAMFSHDAVYDDYPAATVYRGLDEITAYVEHVHGWASDVSIEVTGIHGDARSAAAEWRMRAVQSAPIPGRVPVTTGARIDIRGVTVVETEGGLIRRAADHIDIAPLVLQLGGSISLPGGIEL